jgi:hypothetical protein
MLLLPTLNIPFRPDGRIWAMAIIKVDSRPCPEVIDLPPEPSKVFVYGVIGGPQKNTPAKQP